MNDKQETIADIVAEMRGLVKPGETLNHTYELLSGLADRLEAAVKRECIEVATRAATQGVNLTNEKYANTPIGNTVAMREAVEWAKKKALYISRNYRTPLSLTGNIVELLAYLNAALAAPPRNCDRFGGDIDQLREACARERGMNPEEDFPEVFAEWLLAPSTEKEGGTK